MAGKIYGIAVSLLLSAAFMCAQAAEAPREEPGAVLKDPPQAAADFESSPLSFPQTRRQTQRSEPQAAASGFPSIFSLLSYVLVVCALFAGVLWLAKRYLPGHRQMFSHPSMEVLGRTHLDHQRYAALLRVGKKILVLGVSPDGLTALSEVSDEAEVADLMEIARPKTEAGLSVFQSLFQRYAMAENRRETRAAASAGAEILTDDMSSLRERVKSLRTREDAKKNLDAIG